MNFHAKILVVVAVGLLAGCVTACVHPRDDVRESFIATVSALPNGAFYEEYTEQFVDRVKSGHYWTEQTAEGEVAYLMIGGDGCRSVRLFILAPDGSHYMLENEWEDEPVTDSLMRYHPKTGECDFDRADIPKSILNADGDVLPTQVWQKLKPYLLEPGAGAN
ncbi:MAG: hypothetical protein IKV92_01080 [Akkermansia sp.]|nr:hypothetical protein [Akkermansia sp.]